MHYLVYRSQPKLDMLADQLAAGSISGNLASLKGSVEFSIGLVKAKIEKGDRLAPSDAQKIIMVEEALERENLIGSPDSEKPYFRGELEMRWGAFFEYAADIALFTSLDRRVVLAGSTASLVGWKRDSEELNQAFAYYMMTALKHIDEMSSLDSEPNDVAALSAWTEEKGINTRLKFLARRMGKSDPDLGEVVIGSPIYVALADEPL